MDQTPGLKNKIGKVRDSIDAASRSADRLASATNRFTLALALIALAALAFEVYKYFDARKRELLLPSQLQMPVANPPVDPNRPDLFEEPRIEE